MLSRRVAVAPLVFYVAAGFSCKDGAAPGSVCRSESNTSSLSMLQQTTFEYSTEEEGPYRPGDRGAEWSEEEARIVKGKLFNLFSRKTEPLAPLTLRLGFHDCALYVDGSGGCDGCLGWENMDEAHGWTGCPENIGNKSDNRRLDIIVRKLEDLYHEDLSKSIASLHQTGKSRSDLWAFAAMAAVEYGIHTNNEYCDNPGLFLDHDRVNPQCHARLSESDCKVELPRPFEFQTGRVDCKPTDMHLPYKASKTEVGPNPQGNGQETVTWMKKYFKFDGRETVAIMGAHTIGRFNAERGSCLQYAWTSRSEALWNTQYYRFLARRKDWYFNDDTCTKIGAFSGEKTHGMRWSLRIPVRQGISGTQWFIKMKVCTDGCKSQADEEWKTMVTNRDSGGISTDIGLYYDFSVDSNGIPYGCTGMDDAYKQGRCRICDVECPKNEMAEPAGSTPLYQIVEEYADSPSKWMRDYVPAMEKMLSNGYKSADLHAGLKLQSICDPGPKDGSLMQGRHWICWNPNGLGAPFSFVHRDTNLALTMGKSTGVLMMAKWKSKDHQKWQWTADGKQIINVLLGVPMSLPGKYIGASGGWRFYDGVLFAEEFPPLGLCYRGETLDLFRTGAGDCQWKIEISKDL